MIPFWKLESIGNDFPLIHPDSSSDLDLPQLAIDICDRRFGVGGDGLLTLERGDPLRLRMFNPDGTEDFCGNGVRCAALHAESIGWAPDEFTIEHKGTLVSVAKLADGMFRTEIGAASYEPFSVPLRADTEELFRRPIYWDGESTIQGSALTTGSTHAIVPVDTLPGDDEIESLGPRIEHFDLYPARTSVIWVETIAPDHLRIRIWERGVGETLGCGTGSSAAVADYLRGKSRGGNVRVDNPGGTLWVEMGAWDAPISITGPAEQVFEGEFKPQARRRQGE